VELFGKSIKGRRDSNQDKIYFDKNNDCFIMAVADGIGGNFGGEIASKIVITQCKKIFHQVSDHPNVYNIKNLVRQIYDFSQKVFCKVSKRKPVLKNMGTTLTIVIGYKNQFIVGNIGDSKTFLIRNNELEQLSRDHSYLQEYKEKFPDEEILEIVKKQLGSVITKSVTCGEDQIDIFPTKSHFFKLLEGDLILLCSDGLIIDELGLDSDFFSEMKQTGKNSKEIVNILISRAYDLGSKDNISTIIGIYK